MREFSQSTHLRLKLECLVLLSYVLYHGTGLSFLISSFGNVVDDEGDADRFGEGFWLAFTFSCVMQLMGLFGWIFLAFRIILHYHYREKDEKWIQMNWKIGLVSNLSWGIGLTIFVLGVLVEGFYWWYFFYVALAIVCCVNKSLPIMLVMSILYELDKSTRHRPIRLKQWFQVISNYTTFYLILGFMNLLWLYYLIIPAIIFLSMFFCLCCPAVGYSGCYCVPCDCCPMWNRNAKLKGNLQAMITGGSLFIVVTYFFVNYNTCLAAAIVIEFVSGFRGAALLLIFYVVAISVDLHYGSPIQMHEVKNGALDPPSSGNQSQKSANDAIQMTSNEPVQVTTRGNDDVPVNTSDSAEAEAAAAEVSQGDAERESDGDEPIEVVSTNADPDGIQTEELV